jgi:DNA ligase (NAD+)
VLSDKCKGWNVVFTGFTDADMEKFIVENGGVIGSGVSKKTTHLIMRQKNSGSNKEQKAESLGVPIFDVNEFQALINLL